MDMVRVRVASYLVCCLVHGWYSITSSFCTLLHSCNLQGEETTELELSTNKSVDAALGTDFAQDFDMQSLDVDDVPPPTV